MTSTNTTYQTHVWDEIKVTSNAEPPLKPVDSGELYVCRSGSDVARRAAEQGWPVFYHDLELAALGHPSDRSGGLYRLTEDWDGHAAGQLVMRIWVGGTSRHQYAVQRSPSSCD